MGLLRLKVCMLKTIVNCLAIDHDCIMTQRTSLMLSMCEIFIVFSCLKLFQDDLAFCNEIFEF